MTRAVVGHHLTHKVVERLPVLGLVHVDEVDDDDAAHIAQAQLTGDFVGGAQIHVERVGFLVVACFRTVTRVDVNDV